ncbi:MAG: heparan-alpha-glucosaminide N-acetyltransferase [Bacillota bacterium]|jgi:uncharacterized membrane protein
MNTLAGQRLWEIDSVRGLALVLMIIYHLLYDLNVFFGFSVAYNEGLFYFIGKAAAALFILVAGISCAFSNNNALRGIKLILWGYLIFLVTSLVLPGSNIVFGILQFLGVCFLLYPVFKNLTPSLLLTIGAAIIFTGQLTSQLSVSHNWLAPLGFYGPDFSSVDYFPLIPWLGIFLMGIAIRKTVYKENKSLFNQAGNYFKPLAAVGKRTLTIYLIHQPLILGLLYLVLNPRGLWDMLGKLVVALTVLK